MKNLKFLRVVSLFIVILIFAGAVSFEFAFALTPTTGIKAGDAFCEDVRAWDTVRYTVKLKAAEKFLGIKGEVVYDSSKLTFVNTGTDEMLGNLKGKTSPVLNVVDLNDSGQKKIVFFAAAKDFSDDSKYDFRTEKPLVTLEFKVKDAAYSEINFSVVDMDIDGYRWYFNNYVPETEGVNLTQSVEVTERPETPPAEDATEEITTEEVTTQEPTSAIDKDAPQKGIGVGGRVYYIAERGDSVLYRVKLEAAQLFDVLDLVIAYDSSKLQLARLYENTASTEDASAEGRWLCPNLGNPTANTQVDGIIKLSDIFEQGNDFTQEKILLEIEFEVKDSDYSRIMLRINEMTIKDGEDGYFSEGVAQITEGIKLSQELKLGKKQLPSVPEEPTTQATEEPATNPTQEDVTEEPSTDATEEPTQASTDITEEPATQETSADKTESTTVQPTATEPSSTDANEAPTTDATEEASTDATEVPTTDATKVPESTTDGTENVTDAPVLTEYVLGDANSDGKVNVKDATMVQKSAASLVVLDEVQILAADCDGNNQVNVRDATAIQKYCAEIETGLPVGEKVTKQCA